MSLLNQISENSYFCQNLCYSIGSYAHFFVNIIPMDHSYGNIDDIILNLEYWEEKLVLQIGTWKMDKIYQNLKLFRIHVNGLWQPIPMEK